MSDVFDDDGEVNWRTVFDSLSEGHAVEIPCEKEREFVRRATQVVKRAEKQGLAVAVVRGQNGLRVEPRGGQPAFDDTDAGDESELRTERRFERERRREELRAERAAARERNRDR